MSEGKVCFVRAATALAAGFHSVAIGLKWLSSMIRVPIDLRSIIWRQERLMRQVGPSNSLGVRAYGHRVFRSCALPPLWVARCKTGGTSSFGGEHDESYCIVLPDCAFPEMPTESAVRALVTYKDQC